jgi:dipeptidyl aminopeptidase/acylaminoacyl peptidase
LGYFQTAGGGHRIGRIILPTTVIGALLLAVSVGAPIATQAQRAREAFPTKDGEIIFSSEGPPYPGTVISTINSDGTDLATIPIRPGHDNTFPAWSPDGKRIAFSKGKGDIYTIKLDGTGLRQLTDDKGGEREPTWSPDGKKIAFRFRSDIFLMTANGTGHTNLTENRARADTPTWSPDGKKIAFSSGAGDIFVMKADRTKVEQLKKPRPGNTLRTGDGFPRVSQFFGVVAVRVGLPRAPLFTRGVRGRGVLRSSR